MKLRSAAKAVSMAMGLALASSPFAQPQGPGSPSAPVVARASPTTLAVAWLAQIEGDVLASTESGLAAAGEGAALQPGVRVMTMARSRANVAYLDGCIVTLKPNMRVEIVPGLPCTQRQAMARLMVLDPAAEVALEGMLETSMGSLPAAILGGAVGGPLGAAAGFAGAAAIIANRPGESVSPN
jgi:hypothetical protein